MSDGVIARIVSDIQGASQTTAPETHAEGKTPDNPMREEAPVTPPFTKYSDINKHPYSADYFKIDYFNKLSSDVDFKNVYRNVSDIEKYVTEKIASNKLVDEITTYNNILGEIKNYLGIGNQVKPEEQLNLIAQYIKLKTKEDQYNDKIKKVKEELYKFIDGK